MPVERVSKGFKDISSSFQVNPLNEDLIAIKNETAIARSIRNLILTYTGERFFNPILGSQVGRLLLKILMSLQQLQLRMKLQQLLKISNQE